MKHVSSFAAIYLLGCAFLAPSPGNFAWAQAVEAVPRNCGDFLAQANRKPAHLIYVGCHYLPDRQGKPLSATYRVSGRFAARAEAYLIRQAGLNRLRRSCCQWDSPAGGFKDAKGRAFSIMMVSEQTPGASTRAGWARIPFFEVVVETDTEEI